MSILGSARGAALSLYPMLSLAYLPREGGMERERIKRGREGRRENKEKERENKERERGREN